MKNYNRTIKFGPGSQPEFLSKQTTSGLWAICILNVGELDYGCRPINYFPAEKYRPDDQDSTHAIPYSARNSSVYFLLSFIFLLTGEFFYLITFVKSCKKIFTFCSGISFVLGGLITLVGIINYISIFKAEVGNKLYSRSVLAEPVFTYSYGYSFVVLIFSFLFSEFSGICAIFQFIYHHQYKWDQIEKNNAVENSESTLDKDTSSCKIIATMSNGTIKTLCDTKENNTTCDSLNEMMSKKLESLSGSIQNSPNLRLGPKYFQESHSTIQQTPMLLRDCDCAYLMYQNTQKPDQQEVPKVKYPTVSEENSSFYTNLNYVPRQTTLSSITTETTGFSSSVACSPSYNVPGPFNGFPAWSDNTAKNSINNWVASLKVPGIHGMQGEVGSSSNGSDSSEERRKRVTRHISIDETPITHTYHQNSIESSSQSSHSPSEESSMETSGSTSHNGSRYSNTLERNSDGVATVQNKTSRFLTNGGGSYSSTLPSSMKTNKILKSSLSKTSSLKRSSNYKFETEENLQQIVKQKRENCLQDGLSLSKENIGDAFENENMISQV